MQAQSAALDLFFTEFYRLSVFFLTKWKRQCSNFPWNNKSPLARRHTNRAQGVMDGRAVKMWKAIV